MPLSVRVDQKTEKLIERLARTKGRTKSEVVREAIGVLARQADEADGENQPYETVRDLLGRIKGGPRNLSQRTGELFSRLVREKRTRSR